MPLGLLVALLPPAAPGATGSTLLVFANGRPIGRVALAWDPERVGWYELRLPREATRAGFNRIELALDAGVSPVASGGADSPPTFRLWYLLVRRAPPNWSEARNCGFGRTSLTE